jgi:hypothetical protein
MTMAKGIKKRLEEACAAAGLDPDLQRRLVELVLTATGPGYLARTEGNQADERHRDEAELAQLRRETAKLAASEEEMKMLLAVRSRDGILPAIEATLARREALRAASGIGQGPVAGKKRTASAHVDPPPRE